MDNTQNHRSRPSESQHVSPTPPLKTIDALYIATKIIPIPIQQSRDFTHLLAGAKAEAEATRAATIITDFIIIF
jgi:hypothetical protein